MSKTSDFQPVTFEKDLNRILTDLGSKSILLAGLTEDQHQFQFRVRHLTDDVIYVETLVPVERVLKVDEPMQILFGMPDGLYLIKTKILAANKDQASFALGKDVYRMQRRNNFRTPIPVNYKVSFKMSSFRNATDRKGVALTLVDMSAGGIRVKWPVQTLPQPAVGDHLSGVLTMHSGRQLELFGMVKTVLNGADGLQVGIEFLNLSVRDEQTLLFVCMQILRETKPTSA